jgi:putative selenate reductase
MSVGYDLDGIKSEKIDHFIESLKDASNTESFRECREVLRAHLGEFARFTEADLEAVSPNICSSVTVSTMHGCPPEETERIAMYLLEVKKLNLFLKCNPTLVGYDRAKRVLTGLGFHYIHFEQESFDRDLSFEEAKGLLGRVKERAEALGLFFGVKMTNTFPVLADHGDLPDKMMYMSGRALLPLSLRAASMISEAFDGEISISYCGGADDINIGALFSCGLYPVTVCTDLLKPGGYSRFARMAKRMEGMEVRRKPDGTRIARLAVFLGRPAGAGRVLKRTPHAAPQTAEPCRSVCGVCASLCPNRANVILQDEGKKIMVHLDRLCNECGNCKIFCPYASAPYKDKFTLFASPQDMGDSTNDGFAVLDKENCICRVRLNGVLCDCKADDPEDPLYDGIRRLILTVIKYYPYLIS